MTIRILAPLVLAFLLPSAAFAQAQMNGRVTDARTREPLPFVNVALEGTTQGATTDIEGRFSITDVKPGLYNVQVSSVGYQRRVILEVQVGTARAVELDITLEPTATELKEVEITRKPFQRTQ